MKKITMLIAVASVALLSSSPQILASDDFFKLLAEARTSYESVQDYSALFVKQEGEKGFAMEPEKIYMKFEKPFKILMHWLNLHKKGVQVFYERGRFDNKLVIHKPGLLLGLVPLVYLDQNSPWIKEGSESYNIEDAGIGTFLKDFLVAVEDSHKIGKLKVEAFEGGYKVTFVDSVDDEIYFAYIVDVIFDEATKLPVYMKLYDWEGKPTGIYKYENLHLNSGQDKEFRSQIHGQLLKVYNKKPDDTVKRSPPKTNFGSK